MQNESRPGGEHIEEVTFVRAIFVSKKDVLSAHAPPAAVNGSQRRLSSALGNKHLQLPKIHGVIRI
jgi:hypothetical protein